MLTYAARNACRYKYRWNNALDFRRTNDDGRDAKNDGWRRANDDGGYRTNDDGGGRDVSGDGLQSNSLTVWRNNGRPRDGWRDRRDDYRLTYDDVIGDIVPVI